MKILSLALLSALSVSAQLPGSVSVTSSKLDGERQVRVEPGWLKGDRLTAVTPKLGGFWSDKSPTNFMMEAVLTGAGVPEKLKVGIDGRISEFTAVSKSPGSGYNQSLGAAESSSRFSVPLAFVKDMLTGTNVVIQVSDARSFAEAVFSADGPTRARPGFRKALQKVTGDGSEKSQAKPNRKPFEK